MPEATPTLEGLQRQILELKIKQLEARAEDHERRIRPLEEVATKFNLLLYLTLGGGLIGILNLATMLIEH